MVHSISHYYPTIIPLLSHYLWSLYISTGVGFLNHHMTSPPQSSAPLQKPIIVMRSNIAKLFRQHLPQIKKISIIPPKNHLQSLGRWVSFQKVGYVTSKCSNSNLAPLWSQQDPDIGLEKSVLAIPPLLAVGAIHHYLIQQGLRFTADLCFFLRWLMLGDVAY